MFYCCILNQIYEVSQPIQGTSSYILYFLNEARIAKGSCVFGGGGRGVALDDPLRLETQSSTSKWDIPIHVGGKHTALIMK